MAHDSSFSAALSDLVRALEAEPWCIIGAQAAITYGATRATQDIDLNVVAGKEQFARIYSLMQSAGFVPRIADALLFAMQTRVLLLRHEASQIDIDLVLAGPGLEAIFVERAVHCAMFGLSLPVLCVDDLVACKIFAGRPQDLADVREVLSRTAVDSERICATLRLLEQALDRSDLVQVFLSMQAALARRP